MKTNLRKLAATIISIAFLTSVAIALNPNPTEAQVNLADAANVIMVKVATALLRPSDDDDNPEADTG